MEDFFALCAATLAEREGKASGPSKFVGFPFPTDACPREDSDSDEDDSDLDDFFALRSAAHARDEQEEKSFESMMSQITALEADAATAYEIPEDMAVLKAAAEERWDADEAAWNELVDDVMEVEWGAKREYESDSDDDDDWRVWEELSDEFSHVDFAREFPLGAAPYRCRNHECQRMHYPSKVLQRSRIGRLMRLRRAMQKTREFREKREKEEFAAIAAAAAAAGTIYGLDDPVTSVDRSLSAGVATQAPAAEPTNDGQALTSPLWAHLDTCDAEFDDAALWTSSDDWTTPRVACEGHVSRSVSAATTIIINVVSVDTMSAPATDGTTSDDAAQLTLSDDRATLDVANEGHVSRTVSAASTTAIDAVSVETATITDGTVSHGAALLTLFDDCATPRIASEGHVSPTVSAATSTSINAVSVEAMSPPSTDGTASDDRATPRVAIMEHVVSRTVSAATSTSINAVSVETMLPPSTDGSASDYTALLTLSDDCATPRAASTEHVSRTVSTATSISVNAVSVVLTNIASGLKPPTPLVALKERLASVNQKVLEFKEKIHNVISASTDEEIPLSVVPLVASASVSHAIKDVTPTANAIAPVGNTANSALIQLTVDAIAPVENTANSALKPLTANDIALVENTVDPAVKPPTLKPPTPLASLKRRLASLDQKARELQQKIRNRTASAATRPAKKAKAASTDTPRGHFSRTLAAASKPFKATINAVSSVMTRVSTTLKHPRPSTTPKTRRAGPSQRTSQCSEKVRVSVSTHKTAVNAKRNVRTSVVPTPWR